MWQGLRGRVQLFAAHGGCLVWSDRCRLPCSWDGEALSAAACRKSHVRYTPLPRRTRLLPHPTHCPARRGLRRHRLRRRLCHRLPPQEPPPPPVQ